MSILAQSQQLLMNAPAAIADPDELFSKCCNFFRWGISKLEEYPSIVGGAALGFKIAGAVGALVGGLGVAAIHCYKEIRKIPWSSNDILQRDRRIDIIAVQQSLLQKLPPPFKIPLPIPVVTPPGYQLPQLALLNHGDINARSSQELVAIRAAHRKFYLGSYPEFRNRLLNALSENQIDNPNGVEWSLWGYKIVIEELINGIEKELGNSLGGSPLLHRLLGNGQMLRRLEALKAIDQEIDNIVEPHARVIKACDQILKARRDLPYDSDDDD